MGPADALLEPGPGVAERAGLKCAIGVVGFDSSNALPFTHPSQASVHRLASSGYAGVTELSWSLCNNKGDVTGVTDWNLTAGF